MHTKRGFHFLAPRFEIPSCQDGKDVKTFESQSSMYRYLLRADEFMGKDSSEFFTISFEAIIPMVEGFFPRPLQERMLLRSWVTI